MSKTTIHKEDVKAIIRKRYGSLEAFASARGVKSQAVRDLLRGKARGPIAEVADELGCDPDQLQISQGPVCGAHSNPRATRQSPSRPRRAA